MMLSTVGVVAHTACARCRVPGQLRPAAPPSPGGPVSRG